MDIDDIILPNGWVSVTISEVIESFETVNPSKFPDEIYSYVDIGAINNDNNTITKPKKFLGSEAPSRARRIIQTGDVLFSTVRTYLKNIAVVPEHLNGQLASTGLALLRPNAAITTSYLFSWVRSDSFVKMISNAQDGTLYPAIREKDLIKSKILLPPLGEQKRIFDKASKLLMSVTNARAYLDRVPGMAAQYKSQILFQACNGTLTKNWRNENDEPESRYEILSELVEERKYGTSKKSQKEGDVPVLRMGNIQEGKIDWGDLVFTSNQDEIEKYRLIPGDVLFNRTNSPELVGKTAVYNGERDSIFAGYLIRVRCGEMLLPEYLSYSLNSPQGRAYCWKVKSDGVNQSNINAKKLLAFKLLLPSVKEQKAILNKIEESFQWLDRLLEEYNDTYNLLLKLESAILVKAFSGTLVPQNPNEESANVLLAQIKASREAALKKPRKINPVKKKEKTIMMRTLESVLADEQDWLPAQEAFKRCGIVKGAETKAIEAIYAQLREIDKAGRLAVESVSDDQGRKLFDKLKLKEV